jgi:hypothetical protein
VSGMGAPAKLTRTMPGTSTGSACAATSHGKRHSERDGCGVICA